MTSLHHFGALFKGELSTGNGLSGASGHCGLDAYRAVNYDGHERAS
jgi:hypothetical protein